MVGWVCSKVVITCWSRLSSSAPADQPERLIVVTFAAFGLACAVRGQKRHAHGDERQKHYRDLAHATLLLEPVSDG